MKEKINTLLIDNGSSSIDQYQHVFKPCDITMVSFSKLEIPLVDKYELIILGDGHAINITSNKAEIELVKTTDVPVIGICYGFQLLSVAYGARLEPLKAKREGIVQIEAITQHPMFNGKSIMNVAENHRFAVKKIDDAPLISHAFSADGHEIVEVVGKRIYGFQFHPELDLYGNDGRFIMEGLLKFLF